MKGYVLDAIAVIRYLDRGKDWEKIQELLVKVANDEVRLFLSVINWGEVQYTAAKKVGLPKALASLRTLGISVETVLVDEAETESAASLKHKYKLGYADSFAAELAIRLGATLVTADPDFAKLGKKLKVMPLQRHAE